MAVFHALGSALGWVVNVIQLALWLIQLARLRQKRNQLEADIAALQEELAETRDLANAWWQVTRDAVLMMRERCPRVYQRFAEYYGGVEQFDAWWRLPKAKEE